MKHDSKTVHLTSVLGFNTKNWYIYCDEYKKYFDINPLVLKPATNLQVEEIGLERDYGVMSKRVKFSFVYDTVDADENNKMVECGGELDIPIKEFNIEDIQ